MDKFKQLSELGAGDFEHLDGTLLEHLKSTRELLREWGASSELQYAGLYHAAYGTTGFEEKLVSLEYRGRIKKIVGEAAEEVIYQYCACDREFFFSNFGIEAKPIFKNRFTDELYHLPESMLKMFCELTAANETEIAIDNINFKNKHDTALGELFEKMAPYLSQSAIERTKLEFGKINL